jgi:hypothetical protein
MPFQPKNIIDEDSTLSTEVVPLDDEFDVVAADCGLESLTFTELLELSRLAYRVIALDPDLPRPILNDFAHERLSTNLVASNYIASINSKPTLSTPKSSYFKVHQYGLSPAGLQNSLRGSFYLSE